MTRFSLISNTFAAPISASANKFKVYISSGAAYVKYGFSMAYMTTVLSWGVIRYRRSYEILKQLDEVLETIKWATDYFIKCRTGEYEYYGQVIFSRIALISIFFLQTCV